MNRSTMFLLLSLTLVACGGAAFADVRGQWGWNGSGRPSSRPAPAALIGLGLPAAGGVLIALALVRRFRRKD
jgi:hypothetical protein